MATTKGQRIGIWVIAGMMFLGTVGGFVAMMVAPGNEAKDQAAFKKAQDEYTKATDERKKKVEAQANELSQKYYGKFSEFSSRVGAFEAGDVKELVKEDLVEGEGAEVKDDTKLAVYYIGVNFIQQTRQNANSVILQVWAKRITQAIRIARILLGIFQNSLMNETIRQNFVRSRPRQTLANSLFQFTTLILRRRLNASPWQITRQSIKTV